MIFVEIFSHARKKRQPNGSWPLPSNHKSSIFTEVCQSALWHATNCCCCFWWWCCCCRCCHRLHCFHAMMNVNVLHRKNAIFQCGMANNATLRSCSCFFSNSFSFPLKNCYVLSFPSLPLGILQYIELKYVPQKLSGSIEIELYINHELWWTPVNRWTCLPYHIRAFSCFFFEMEFLDSCYVLARGNILNLRTTIMVC